jgi:beta-lactamase class D
MGFDSAILKNAEDPSWEFEEGYDAFLASWKMAQTPASWIKNSCVWYSQVLATKMGIEVLQSYLGAFDYGNQDMSGGLTNAWLSSSLKISPREQVNFIRKMLSGALHASQDAVQKTKGLVFLAELSDGWQLYGKTGWSGPKYD